MTVPSSPAGTLSRAEKQELLRKVLMERIHQTRTAPASFAQERLWFVDRMHAARGVYNVPHAVRLTALLDVAALERALGEIVRRHEALRTTFAEVDGSPVQVIAPFSGFHLPVEDLSHLAAAQREAELRRRVDDEASRTFDLAAGPLFRPALLRLAADDHVLILSMHHAVSDGWSLGVLRRELAALYAAYRDGAESPLPVLPVQYANYAAWQREQWAGGAMAGQLAWWRERLAGAPALIELPLDHPRPAVQAYEGAEVPVTVAGGLVDRLRAVGRGQGATLYMAVLAAFQALLSRHGAGDDVVVGTPIAGRTRGEVEGLIGFFVNTLALRADLSGDPEFHELLSRVRRVTLGAFEHQEVPFEKVVAELQPERSLGHSPLFQVSFALDDGDTAPAGVPGVGAADVAVENRTSKFDLDLTLAVSGQGLSGAINYRTDLFERATIERMAAHLGRVLEQVATDPGVRLSALSLLDAGERRVMVEDWNLTARSYPRGVCIHQLFEAQVRARPDAIALEWGDARVTYAELDARANRLARHLVRRGVRPDSRVGVLLERGADLIVSILAVLKAGGCYVPLDPAYPAERLRLMLADAGASVLVTTLAAAASLDAPAVTVIPLDAAADAIAAESPGAPESGASPENLAYIVYTSGSTGKPKGVMVAHRHVVQLVCETDYVRFAPGDRVAQASNASFDALTFEAWGALINGATLVGIDRDVLLSAPALREFLRDRRITTLYQTTALLNQLSREQPDIFSPLREVLFGGQAADAASIRRILKAGKPGRLLHMYGPTETTAWCSWHDVRNVADDALTVSIGRPTGNQRIYVLDDALQPVPIGVPGEAWVGGDGVVRGYLDRPALTAERFVPDPFTAERGARMYRTGDRVRWMADGALEFVGRVDAQVKIRGFRIEPGEIESVLAAHPAVREARVIVREDVPGEKRLVAYVVGDADADALRADLRRSLPEYMVPAAFVALDRLPLTPNGKLDVKALPAPEMALAGDRYVAPRTPVEEMLAGIWAEVLQVERVGTADNFFETGGHSLLATRVVSRVRAVFGVELPLRAVFERPTVAELAESVDALRRDGAPVLPPVVPVDRTRALPLTFAQERLWFLDQMEQGNATYNIYVPLRLSGELDVAALERALGEIVRRHEALRTTFADVDGSPAQVIAPFRGFHLPIEDISHLAAFEREAEVRRRVDDEVARPFDLSAGPLFRATLLRLGADDHALIVSMHHSVGDGWSLGVLRRELAALYAAYRDGAESPLAELPVQYADYAVWQREQLRGPVLERELGWWRERLAGAPALIDLPLDHPRPAVQAYEGAEVPVTVAGELVERLRAVGRGQGATLYMVVLAAFQALLSRHGAGDDVVVGTPIAGRTRGEVEGLIGFFVNTLALRTDLSGDPAFHELLSRVRRVTLGAFDHQEVPFEKVVAELQPERSLGHSPLFQVSFALDDADTAPAGVPGLGGVDVEVENRTSKFDLDLTLAVNGQGLSGAINYRTDLFERATIERMAAHLGRVLEQVAADPGVRLSALSLLDAGERRVMVEDWNQTARPYPRGVCIHQLFEAQVRARPDAVALEWGDARLTYAELDARANRLAHHLVRRGVRPDSRVGVLLERGADLVVSILAVLKAGGCYVPLDPAYPAERLRLMLADAGASVLVTTLAAAASLDAPAVTVIPLDASADAIAAESPGAPESGASPENLAYIVYTSGSTGKPKGVMVAHRHVVQLVCETDYVRFAPGDRVAQASNASFDALTFEAWGALMNGATLVGIDRDVLLSAPALREFLRERRITTLYQTTALLNQLTREQPDIFSPLREVLFGGQAADAASIRRILKAGKPGRLLHMYGPTETTAWCSWHDVRNVADDALTVSIGRPTGNQRIYVLDDALQPTPIGVPGEAWVGGDGIVRGYLDRPALTAERFIPDPFTAERGARMYRTGDRVRWMADGTLEFVGRVDEQVKIRGFRIEPGEIESVLAAHRAVREARVIVREDVPGEKRLAAYVVGDAGDAVADALRADLRRSLPEYMVPAAFVAVDRLPLTPNGKLDVKALPAPEMALAGDRYVAPRTPVEEVLAGIWAEVLQLERVGTADNFFETGGHSLLATRVVSRVRSVFGVELPLRAVFERPTVAALAESVDALRRDGAPVLPPVVPVDRTRALPLTFAQERLWFLDQMEQGNATYNIYVPLRLSGELDVAALERALGEIVRRHEALRTTFAEVDGSPAQVIAPFRGFHLPIEDISHLDTAAREAHLAERAADEASRPFDLSAGPLFRATLLRLAGDDHALLIALHHAVGDGWTLGVLRRELSVLYAAYRDGAESPLAELPVQYADYAVWQREQLRGAALERELGWWREQLAGAPALIELPLDHPRPAVQASDGANVEVAIPAGLVEPLRALGRGEGATLFMVMLGAFQALLARYAGTASVVVGTPVAGRTRGEVEALAGFFVNTLALRTDLSGDPTFRELLARVRQVTLGAFEHQEVPFEKLVAELHPERSLSHSPLFQVMFSLDAEAPASVEMAGVRVAEIAPDGHAAKFDLVLGLAPRAGGLAGSLTYRTDLFEPGTVGRMAAHLSRVLAQVAADPGVRLSALELMDADERRRVLEEWNRTTVPFRAELCVHQRIAGHAARTPHAPAVEDGERVLTYRELDRAAGRVAHRLRRRGVGPDVPVGVCMERGAALIVAALGVMKAGGAYVALDPAYPASRLGFMLHDSGVKVLLAGEALRERLPAPPGVEVLDAEALAAGAGANPEPADGLLDSAAGMEAGPRNLAYVIYTSGSTGTPKGVAVEHAGLAALCAWHAAAFAVTPADRATQLASPGFDASAWEVWPYLACGASVGVVPDAVRGDPAALRDWIVARRVTHAFVPTPIAEPLLGVRWPGETPLRWLLAGGDRLQARPDPRLPFALANNYGPTECTVVATSGRVSPGGEHAPDIGTPIHNTRCYVLGPAMRPLPAGVAGELCIGGAQVARGYLRRPALTAERFVPDPFSPHPGARLYRTGDRVRWSAAGTLAYLGRLDEQVKIRGFRIEPGEIEAALRLHPEVRDCVVAVRHDAPGEPRLAAYVVGGAEPAALRAHLRRRLPDYMVPAAIVPLGALPLTPGGKVDRRALPAPAAEPAGDRRRAPETGLEARIAAVWQALLGVAEVGADDNFFDLGGHSVLLVKLQARLAAETGREIPVVDLFQYPTVRSLAAWLHGAGTGTRAVEAGEERGGARQAGVNRLEARRAARLAPRRG